MADSDSENSEMLITLTADIVAAHITNNNVDGSALPSLISSVYGALAAHGTPVAVETRTEPAVSIRSSVKNDHIVWLECGTKMKMLIRVHCTAVFHFWLDRKYIRVGAFQTTR